MADAGSRRRSWFADEYSDLMVWFDPDGDASGYHLRYDKKGKSGYGLEAEKRIQSQAGGDGVAESCLGVPQCRGTDIPDCNCSS